MPTRNFATSGNPAQNRRSVLSERAGWPSTTDSDFTPDARAEQLAAERTGATPTDAVRCEGLRRKLITLFNEPEIEWSEKKDALAYLETIRLDLRRLENWRRAVAAEVSRRRAQGPRRRLALRATLSAPCPACGGTPGYNAESCQACADYVTSKQAA